MSNKIYKTYVEKTGGTPADSYVGNRGEVYYDPDTSAVRFSDGIVPGGQVVSVQTVENLVNEKRVAYEESIETWKYFQANEFQHERHPWFKWNVTGENVDEYLAELLYGWQVQTAPSSPPIPSSPPAPAPELIFVPPISAAYYNQIRSVLNLVKARYAAYLLALQAKQIVGDSLTIPTILYTEIDEDLVLTVRYTSLASGGGNIINERQFKFSTNGTLTFPDGSIQSGAAITRQELKSIVAQSSDFAQFKSLISYL